MTSGEFFRQINMFVRIWYISGHDTTGSALLWIMYELARHPEYQHQCREEVAHILHGLKANIFVVIFMGKPKWKTKAKSLSIQIRFWCHLLWKQKNSQLFDASHNPTTYHLSHSLIYLLVFRNDLQQFPFPDDVHQGMPPSAPSRVFCWPGDHEAIRDR